MATYTTKYEIGDGIIIAYPHDIEAKKPSFPDFERTVTHCEGRQVVTVTDIRISSMLKYSFNFSISYGYNPSSRCECGREVNSNFITENSANLLGKAF